jgi:ABC-2 type transport system permease protein
LVAPFHALVAAMGIVVVAASATQIQLWFRSEAKRGHFQRRLISSRVATFAETLCSITWAATATLATAGSTCHRDLDRCAFDQPDNLPRAHCASG